MPTYDYECSACGHRFEKFQSITAEPVKTCPECKKRKVKRLIGIGAGVIFRGGGFYETDYRSDSYAKDAKNDSGAAGETKDEAKSDSKPETKPETKPDTKAATKPDAKSEPKAATKPDSKRAKGATKAAARDG